MYGSAEIITALEGCARRAFWMRTWRPAKKTPTEILLDAVERTMQEEKREDLGEFAGECVMEAAESTTIDTKVNDLYGTIIHHAALADVISSALRKPREPAWLTPEPLESWEPSCFLSPDGFHLRRIVLVTDWNEDRHYSCCRSWQSLGAVCAYGLPLQMAVIVLGANRDGKRHGPWAKGLLHPANKKLRFRKKTSVSEPFKSSWNQIWREDRDEISTRDWLEAMLQDGVLPDVCFNVEIPVPAKAARDRICDLAKRRLEQMAKMKALPDMQLSTCDWPKPCDFRTPCHGGREPQKGPFQLIAED